MVVSYVQYVGVALPLFCICRYRSVVHYCNSNMDLNEPDQVVDNRLPFRHGNRRLGKKIPRKDGEVGKLTNATARVQHMERSKVRASFKEQ